MDQPGVLTVIRVENNYTVTLDLPIKGTSTPGGTVWVTDEDRHDLIQAIDAATEAINRPSAIELPFRGDPTQLAEAPRVRSLRDLGQLTYGLFLPTPVQEELRHLRMPLILSTNDPAIPWELLHDGQEFLALRQPLARRLVGRLPSHAAPRPPSKSPTFLFIANPMEDLPESKTEALYLIEALTERGVNCDLLQGPRATYINVQDALRSGRYTVIHYTGHAFFDPNQPDHSGLRLAGGRVLPANQIERLLQGHPLVFLNACSSGRESTQRTDKRLPISYIGPHAEGLATAFILGGALGFIGTLWPVFDEGSRQFALRFYQQLLDGWDIGEALRHTRNALRAQRPTDVTWASFNLYGDPSLRLILEEPPTEMPSVPPLEEDSEAATLYEHALIAFDQGQWQQAIRLFNRVLALAGPYRDTVPRLSEANRQARIAELLTLAQTAFDEEHYSEAMVFCADILTLESGERTARALLRRAQKAQALYNNYVQGRAALEAGDWAQAIERLERVAARQPDYKDTQSLLAQAYEKHQIKGQAAKLYTQAQAHMGRKAWTQAVGTLEDLLALAPDYRDAISLLFQAKAAMEPEERVATLYQRAQAALAREDRSVVLTTMEEITKLRPGYWVVDSLLAQTQEEIAQAEEARRQAAQLATLYERAARALQDEQWQHALGVLNRVEALQPGYRDVDTLRSQAQAELAAQRSWRFRSPSAMMAGNFLLVLLLVAGGVGLAWIISTRGYYFSQRLAAPLPTAPEATMTSPSGIALALPDSTLTAVPSVTTTPKPAATPTLILTLTRSTSLAAPASTSATRRPAATREPTYLPTTNPNFRADTSTVASGECTTLRWDVEGVHAVYLDGWGQLEHGSTPVCPTQPQTFTLTVVERDGREIPYRLTIAVAGIATAPTFVIEYQGCIIGISKSIGQMKGQVFDRSGRPIAGAVVEVTVDGIAGVVPPARSNEAGWYEWNLTPGQRVRFVSLKVDGQQATFVPRDFAVDVVSGCSQRVNFRQR